MKVNTATREVRTSDEVVHQSFRIGDPSKMFGILADKIYSDKPRAVIREIACNALDAHTSIGQTLPFQISVPSPLEPMFTVRDFGPGLSHEDVIGLYTTFFDSTKSSGNDQVGGFGLGSKSPFAYTDAFTVTSIQGGKKRVYAAFRGPNNIPQISLASTENTNDPEGLEVRVPVKKEDLAAFKRTAEDVLQWFPEGSYEAFGFTPPKVEWLFRTPKWGVRKGVKPTMGYDQRTYQSVDTGQRYAIMGPVGYALDWKMAVPNLPPLPACVVPFFDIGELDLPPSRETLSYDPATIQQLKDMNSLIRAELPALAHKTGKAMDPWDQCAFVAEIKNIGLTEIIAPVCNPGNTIKSQPFSDMADGIRLAGSVDIFEQSYRSNNLRRQAEPSADYIYKAGDRSQIVFDDLAGESPGKKRVLSRLNHHGGNRYLVIRNEKNEYADFEHLKKTFGKAPNLDFLFKLSDLEIPPVASFASSSAYQMRLSVSRNGSGFWEDTLKPQPGDVWWPLSGHDIEDHETWRKLVPFLSGQNVFGLTKTAQKAFDTNQMVKADKFVEDKIAELAKNSDAMAWVKSMLAYHWLTKALNEDDNLGHLWAVLREREDRGVGLFPELKAFAKVCDRPDNSTQGSLLLTAIQEGKVKEPSFKNAEDVIETLRNLYEEQPLLKLSVRMRQSRHIPLLGMENDAFLSQLV